jgi:lysophospholipase L1-like esterase
LTHSFFCSFYKRLNVSDAFKAFLLLLFVFSQTAHGQNILESGTATLNRTGCTISGGIINITGTGNIQANKAYLNSETTLEEIDMHFGIKINSLDGSGNYAFGIGKNGGLAGTLVKFGGTASGCTISVYRLNGTIQTLVSQIPLPFNLNTGVDYTVRVGKRIRNLLIEIMPDDSSNYFYNDSLSYPTPFFGLLWGSPFIGCETGTIAVSDFILTTPLNLSPRLAVWGDSFIEGSSLPLPEQRYVSLIKDSITYQNVSIMGRGGESSSSINTRFSKESRWFSGSKYALVAIGVNDNSFSTWKTNMEKHIDTLKMHNIVPIIATLSPRADRLPFIAQVNNWIRNVYNGAYVDASLAVSPTGTYWGTGMGMTDSIHPTPAGHQAIYDRITLEAPYIFRDSSVFTIDYMNEVTFENVAESLEYSALSNFTASLPGNLLQIPVIPGENIYFRDTATTPGIHILFDVLAVPKRPAAPTNPIIDQVALTFDWTNNSFFPDVSDYEFSIDSGAIWTTCFQKPISNPGSSFVQLRVRATISSFKSSVLYFDATTVGLEPLAQNNNILVYPNPISDRLVIENISEATRLAIYSAEGLLIKEVLLENEMTVINTGELSAGFYILTLNNRSLNKSFKIVKK